MWGEWVVTCLYSWVNWGNVGWMSCYLFIQLSELRQCGVNELLLVYTAEWTEAMWGEWVVTCLYSWVNWGNVGWISGYLFIQLSDLRQCGVNELLLVYTAEWTEAMWGEWVVTCLYSWVNWTMWGEWVVTCLYSWVNWTMWGEWVVTCLYSWVNWGNVGWMSCYLFIQLSDLRQCGVNELLLVYTAEWPEAMWGEWVVTCLYSWVTWGNVGWMSCYLFIQLSELRQCGVNELLLVYTAEWTEAMWGEWVVTCLYSWVNWGNVGWMSCYLFIQLSDLRQCGVNELLLVYTAEWTEAMWGEWVVTCLYSWVNWTMWGEWVVTCLYSWVNWGNVGWMSCYLFIQLSELRQCGVNELLLVYTAEWPEAMWGEWVVTCLYSWVTWGNVGWMSCYLFIQLSDLRQCGVNELLLVYTAEWPEAMWGEWVVTCLYSWVTWGNVGWMSCYLFIQLSDLRQCGVNELLLVYTAEWPEAMWGEWVVTCLYSWVTWGNVGWMSCYLFIQLSELRQCGVNELLLVYTAEWPEAMWGEWVVTCLYSWVTWGNVGWMSCYLFIQLSDLRQCGVNELLLVYTAEWPEAMWGEWVVTCLYSWVTWGNVGWMSCYLFIQLSELRQCGVNELLLVYTAEWTEAMWGEWVVTCLYSWVTWGNVGWMSCYLFIQLSELRQCGVNELLLVYTAEWTEAMWGEWVVTCLYSWVTWGNVGWMSCYLFIQLSELRQCGVNELLLVYTAEWTEAMWGEWVVTCLYSWVNWGNVGWMSCYLFIQLSDLRQCGVNELLLVYTAEWTEAMWGEWVVTCLYSWVNWGNVGWISCYLFIQLSELRQCGVNELLLVYTAEWTEAMWGEWVVTCLYSWVNWGNVGWMSCYLFIQLSELRQCGVNEMLLVYTAEWPEAMWGEWVVTCLYSWVTWGNVKWMSCSNERCFNHNVKWMSCSNERCFNHNVKWMSCSNERCFNHNVKWMSCSNERCFNHNVKWMSCSNERCFNHNVKWMSCSNERCFNHNATAFNVYGLISLTIGTQCSRVLFMEKGVYRLSLLLYVYSRPSILGCMIKCRVQLRTACTYPYECHYNRTITVQGFPWYQNWDNRPKCDFSLILFPLAKYSFCLTKPKTGPDNFFLISTSASSSTGPSMLLKNIVYTLRKYNEETIMN